MSDLPGSTPPSSPAGATPPGWHPDPLDRYDHRWFDGTGWTDQVSDDGRPTVDPYGISPSPAGAPAFQPAPYADAQFAEPQGRNGIAVAALVCGIIGMLIAWIPFITFGGLVLAILGLVFGIIGLRRSNTVGKGRGQAITGIVTGSIGLALAVLGIVLTVFFWGALNDFIDPGPHSTTVEECTVTSGFATVSGTLTNEGRDEQSFTLFVEVDNDTGVVTVDDVPAGETVNWRAGANVDADDGACDPQIIVNGPFPFGVEIDPID